jgi:GNAT superfamily N-acetyltransferase
VKISENKDIPMIEIRPAGPSDIQHLFDLIMDSAEETNSRSEVATTPEKLLADGFGPHPSFQALIAWDITTPIGFALWFPMYSSWKGKRSLYLEELYIRPFWRKQGIAKRLCSEIEKIALLSHANLAWECDRDRLDLRHFFVHMGAIDRSSKISFYMEESDMSTHLKDSGALAPQQG